MQFLIKRAVLIITLSLVAAAAGCGGGQGRATTIAVVNGHEIDKADFERFLSLKLGELNSPETSDLVRSQLLDEYIRRRIVLDEAAREGLSVTDIEIDQATLDNPQMRAMMTNAATREEVARDLMVRKYYRQVVQRDVRVSREEIDSYIEQNSARLRDRAILFVREIRVQAKEQAEAIRREVTEGRKDFASVARLSSEASNAAQGGLARYEQGQLPDVLAKAVEPLRPGEVSPVIQSNFGFHIFKLERRVEPQQSEERRAALDDRRLMLIEELIARKNQQAVDARVEEFVSAATIKINEAALGFTYAGQLKK